MDNLKDFFLDLRDDTLDFIDDHRKGLIIVSFIAILLLIGLMIMFIMFTPVKITIAMQIKKWEILLGQKQGCYSIQLLLKNIMNQLVLHLNGKLVQDLL